MLGLLQIQNLINRQLNLHIVDYIEKAGEATFSVNLCKSNCTPEVRPFRLTQSPGKYVSCIQHDDCAFLCTSLQDFMSYLSSSVVYCVLLLVGSTCIHNHIKLCLSSVIILSSAVACDPSCVDGICVSNDTCVCDDNFSGKLCTIQCKSSL